MRWRLGAAGGVLLLGVALAVAAAPPASAITRTNAVASAARYARSQGYHIGIAVYDTRSGRVYGGGDDRGTFASESVVKTMIATRLLVQGRMHGTTASRAWRMITRSDDAIASSFYGSVGGDNLINWVKRRYHVWNLGSPPTRANWWGNTHITPRGLVTFYARVKRDRRVGPWLLSAMHHAKPYGSDGTYQFFGLPSATRGAAVKQGWGADYDDWGRSADFNTTGFVNRDRYAVAILARGPIRYYGAAISSMLTHTARRLLPGGRFPDPLPTVTRLTRAAGKTAGGQRVGVYGSSFTHVRAVYFGYLRGTAIRVVRATYLVVTTPRHPAGSYPVRVITDHGSSGGRVRFRFVRPPAISAVQPTAGPTGGGQVVTVTGGQFTGATKVLFSGVPGTSVHVRSDTSLTVVTPQHSAGTVNVRVVTPYGWSPIVAADRYTYAAAPNSSGGSDRPKSRNTG